MEDYTICTHLCWLDHFLEQKLYFSMASRSDEARLCSGDGFSVSLPAQLLLAASKLARDTFTPGQTEQDVFLPSVRGSTLLLLVEILRTGRTSSLGMMDNMGYMLKELQATMELLEIPGLTSLMRVQSKPGTLRKQDEVKAVKNIAPPSMIHFAIEECPISITPVMEVTQMNITSYSVKNDSILVSTDFPDIKVKSELPKEELSMLDENCNEQVKENVLSSDCHICKVCKKQFAIRKNLLEHFRRIHREVMFSCEHCDKKFISECNLKNHIKSHQRIQITEELTQSINPVVEVTQMSNTPDSQEEGFIMVNKDCVKNKVKSEPFEDALFRYEEQVKENVLPKDCYICKKQFMKRRNMLEHFRTVHREVMCSCEHCDMKFVTEVNLKKHIKTHSEQVKGNFLPRDCQICKKQFRKRSNLLKHLRGVHSEGIFSCDNCDMKFVSEFSLKKHIETHQGNRIQCKFCMETLRSKVTWYKHMRRSHRVELFSCQECDKKFVLEASLRAHVLSCHDGIPFQCSECPATFSKKTSMQMHMRNVHSGVVFVCEYCSSTFSHSGNLKRHMINVHKKLLDLTDKCGELFDVNENKNIQECPNKEEVVH